MSLPLTPGQGVFSGTVDIGDHRHVGLEQRFGELGVQELGARVEVGLEDGDHPRPLPFAGGRRVARSSVG